VVDGTVYVGSDDANVYAIEAGVSGSSEGSRVRHRALGHHDRFGSGENNRGDGSSEGVSLPGFGVGAAVAGLGATAAWRWFRADADSSDAPE
jgi:hypothetical protein